MNTTTGDRIGFCEVAIKRVGAWDHLKALRDATTNAERSLLGATNLDQLAGVLAQIEAMHGHWKAARDAISPICSRLRRGLVRRKES